MKLSFDRKDFLEAAKRLCKVAPPTHNNPILTGVLLEADAENLEVTLTATDLITTVCCNLSAAVYEGGSVVVNAELFANMLRLFDEATVSAELSPNGRQISLSCGNAVFTIGALSGEAFPRIPVPNPEYTGKLAGLPSLAKHTAFLVPRAKVDGESPKHCVRLELSNAAARAISTDGSRLMCCTKPLQGENKPVSLLLPVEALTLLASMVGEEETLRLKSSARFITFESDKMAFITRLGTGSYIDADSVLSAVTALYEAVVDAKALQDALDAAESVALVGDQLNMVFRMDGIGFESNSERAKSKFYVIAQVTAPMPPEGFYYPLKKFCQGIAAMSGILKLSVTSAGFLLVEGTGQTLFQSPVQYREKVLKRPDKPKNEDEKPAKKTKTTKKAAKAA